MTRKRLRPAWDPGELARIYATPHQHTHWQDHRLRVGVTAEIGRWLAVEGEVRRTADLSCGDGAVLSTIPAEERVFGDLAPGYEVTGPIEETLSTLKPVDLLVCCETLEHLDDPDSVLAAARARTRFLLLSTPVDAWGDTNLEHYWAWSRADVEEMLRAAGFTPMVYAPVDFTANGKGFYQFGIWGCR